MTKISLFSVLFIGILIISGCKLQSPEDGDDVDPVAIVEGSVQNSDGEPLYDVIIDITTFKTTCGEGGVNHGTVTTNNEGEFLKSLARSEEVTINCITVHTSSKTRTQFKDSTISRSADLDFKTSQPFDSEIINITY